MKKIITILFFCLFTISLQAQIIENIEETVSSGGSSSSSSDFNGGLFFDLFFWDIIEFCARVMVITPSEYENLHKAENGGIDLSPYPYAGKSTSGTYLPQGEIGKRFQLRLNADYQNHKGSLNSYYGSAELFFQPVFSIQAEHLHYIENRLDGNTDKLTFTNIHLNWNRLMHPNVHLEYGFGFSAWEGEEAYSSIGGHVGLTIYPVRPISLHTRWIFSNSNNVSISQGHLQAAYHYNRMNIHAGAHFLNVGGGSTISPKIGLGVVF